MATADEYRFEIDAEDNASEDLENLEDSLNDVDEASDRASDSTDDASDSMSDGESQASTFADVLKADLAAGGLEMVSQAAIEVSARMVQMTADFTAATSKVERQANSVDVTTGKYQELQFAMNDLGLESEVLQEQLGDLAERQQDAIAGGEGSGIAADFAAIGISVEQLKDKNPAEVLELVTDGIASAETESKAMKGAVSLLSGEVATELVPKLRENADWLDKVATQARVTGNVMDEQTIAKAKDANDELKRLTQTNAGLRKEIGSLGTEALEQQSERLSDYSLATQALIKDTQNVTEASGAWADTLRWGTRASLFGATMGLSEVVIQLDQSYRDLGQTYRQIQRDAERLRKENQKTFERTKANLEMISELQRLANDIQGPTDTEGSFEEKSREETDVDRRVAEAQQRGREMAVARLKTERKTTESVLQRARLTRQINDHQAQSLELQAQQAESSVERVQLTEEAQRLRIEGDEAVEEARDKLRQRRLEEELAVIEKEGELRQRAIELEQRAWQQKWESQQAEIDQRRQEMDQIWRKSQQAAAKAGEARRHFVRTRGKSNAELEGLLDSGDLTREAQKDVRRELDRERGRDATRRAAIEGTGRGLKTSMQGAGGLVAEQQRLLDLKKQEEAATSDQERQRIQRQIDLEKQHNLTLQQKLDLYGKMGGQVGELSASIAELADSSWDFSNAQDAALGATKALSQVGAVAGDLLGKSTKQKAGIKAAFETASAVAMWAAYAGTGGTNPAFLSSAIQHTTAAAMFGAIGSGAVKPQQASPGAAAGMGGGATGGSAASASSGRSINLAEQREKSAKAYADALKEQQQLRPIQYNLDLSGSVQWREADRFVQDLKQNLGDLERNSGQVGS